VEPRFGRLYATTVLRPLAEQLVAELGVRPGEVACDLLCDSGTLGAAFAGVVGAHGRVTLVDSDVALLQAASDDVSHAGCAVDTSEAGAMTVPLEDASYDRVGSLCTFGFWSGTSLLDEAMRITRPLGGAAVLTWDPDDPPAHERALVDALRNVAGIDSRFLRECLAAPETGHRGGWHIAHLRDVVRFDGIAQYWAAMVLERPRLTELGGASEQTVGAMRRACEVALQEYIAADGTIRIPVTATMWRHTKGSGD
jgi:SAM-dependent methyltransferase